MGCAAPAPDGTPAPLPSGTTTGSEASKVWTPAKQMKVQRVTNPRLSPSGERIVFQVAHADLETDRWVPRLHLATSDGRRGGVPLERCAGCRDVLLQHGTNDPRVPIAPVRIFAAALDESGIKHDFRTYDGGHGPRTPRVELAVLEQNLDWFIRTLRDRDPTQALRGGDRIDD